MNIAAPLLSQIFSLTLGKFLTVGVLNTGVTIAVIFIAKAWLGCGDIAANASGYVVGMICSFFLNKFWTFSHKGDTFQTATRFILLCGVAYLANLLALKGFLSLGLNPYVCHILAMPFYTLLFYAGSKAVVFAERSDGQTSGHNSFLAGFAGSYRHADDEGQKIRLQYVLLFLFAVVASISVLFYRLTDVPVEIWDEARLANNALEMSKNGLSLITTYDWLPDHWNTKPPLLIWLMAISMKLVGINELGLRLPSVLASLGTILLVFWFVGHCLRRPVQAFLAVILILASPGYIQIHGARSGNYDALLALLTTTYLISAFVFLESETRNKRMYFVLTTVTVVLAFYTKAIQGLIFLPTLFIYALFNKKLGSLLRQPYVYAGLILAALACITYYWLRNQIDPGYFSAVQANDLGGRYANALEGHQGSILWYVGHLKHYPWLVPSFILAAYVLIRGSNELRKLVSFLAIASFCYLTVISSAGTKLVWYAIPLVPLSAILCALGAGEIAAKLRLGGAAAKWHSIALLGVAGTVSVFALNAVLVHRSMALKEAKPYEQHSFALRSLIGSNRQLDSLIVLHPGYPVAPGSPFYAASTMFYANALTLAGTPTTIVQHLSAVGKDATLLVCGDEIPVKGSKIALLSGKDCALHVPESKTGIPPEKTSSAAR
jgi:4-amino-4-deoxy-L-arabinose transferase-like glycosyltransferase/putative flippase GtrA